MPPVAAKWLTEDTTLVPKYREYAQHIVVADENFLPTMFRNSPYCSHHVSTNYVHVQVRGCQGGIVSVLLLVVHSAALLY